jgi:uncharacterized iron-regulated membrane protein
MNFRNLHRKIAPVLFLPLCLSALTGLAYRIGNSWFGLPNDFGALMLTIHTGRFLGQSLSPFYVLLVGLGLIGIVVTGLNMLLQIRPNKNTAKLTKPHPRSWHRWLAPIFFLPLFVSASTGIMYRLGKLWFDLPKEQTKLLIDLHQGTYLGQSLRPFYVLFVGLGLLGMLVTGIQMTSVFRKQKA